MQCFTGSKGACEHAPYENFNKDDDVYFQYGSHRHADSEVQLVSLRKQAVENERGEAEAVRWTMQIRGVIAGDSQDALRSAIQTVEQAYSRNGEDAGLYHDDGTPSPHVMKTKDAIGGVRIASLAFSEASGEEYAVQRTYDVVLEADFPAPAAGDLQAWEETLAAIG